MVTTLSNQLHNILCMHRVWRILTEGGELVEAEGEGGEEVANDSGKM